MRFCVMYVKFVPVRFLLYHRIFYHRIFYVHQVNEEGPADCVIWKKSSTVYKKQAAELDGIVCIAIIVRPRVNVQVI